MDTRSDDGPARFFDSRAAYLLFVTTTNEKAVVADRIGQELGDIEVSPPGFRVLDAGMGDASVLSGVLRRFHDRSPHVPVRAVAKEISIEDVRVGLSKLPDLIFEHPETVFVVTNLPFAQAAALRSDDPTTVPVWREVPLEGSTTHGYLEQIRALFPQLAEDWRVRTSERTGNPVPERPAVVVLYRRDRDFLLRPLIPSRDGIEDGYDLVIASQVYRARTPVERKVSGTIVPLARALARGGKLVVVHAHGDDPGLEIVRGVWPGEDPFPDGRAQILAQARSQLSGPADADLIFEERDDDEAFFRYDLHAMPSVRSEHIGTSTTLAAWSAAAYVAQIDEARLAEATVSGAYLEATHEVLRRHGAVWFNDEAFVIRRAPASI
jgi:hypothetical protein